MLSIKESQAIKTYNKIIERIGDKFVLLKIVNKFKVSGQYTYLFFRAPNADAEKYKRKLPLEIALTGDDDIERIGLYAEGIVPQLPSNLKIQYTQKTIGLSESEVNPKKFTYEKTKEFDIFRSGQDIYVIQKNNTDELYAYDLAPAGYILITGKPEVAGLILKDLTEEEMQVLQNANVL